MGVMKENSNKIESFKFGQLIPDQEHEFKNMDKFELKSLNAAQDFKHNLTPQNIRTERECESASAFTIDSRVKQHRGLQKQADDDYETQVENEVIKRLELYKAEAYKEGFEVGKNEGYEAAYAESKQNFEEKVNQFVTDVEGVNDNIQKLYANAKDNVYLMAKNLSKWIILKEVDEKYYLARLLEKLIHEINTKSNLVIHMNEQSFGYMPEIIKIVERKVGKLTNIRMEVDLDMKQNGIKLESANNIIDGSLNAQFESLDKLFHSVGLNDQ